MPNVARAGAALHLFLIAVALCATEAVYPCDGLGGNRPAWLPGLLSTRRAVTGVRQDEASAIWGSAMRSLVSAMLPRNVSGGDLH